jgi:hypothetical protein
MSTATVVSGDIDGGVTDIFEKIRNGALGIIRGPGVEDS